jgi:hypothetical protein
MSKPGDPKVIARSKSGVDGYTFTKKEIYGHELSI